VTDDLVKRLKDDFSVNAREDIQNQMKVYEAERKEAADRIEQLEAALREIANCVTLPAQNDIEMREIACAALGEKKDV
jgi:hypothetical protein